MKKNDVILIAAILVLALAALAGTRLYSDRNTKDAQAVVTVNGKEYGRFSLKESRSLKIEGENGHNLLVIENGEADITDATCPDRICVNHKKISRKGESLVCLPNQVVVEIQNGGEAEVDSSTH